MSPPPRPDTTANTTKPTGSNFVRRAITPPSTAFANTPVRSSTRNRSVTGTPLTALHPLASATQTAGHRSDPPPQGRTLPQRHQLPFGLYGVTLSVGRFI